MQLRTNFMDPGLQRYGGELFDFLQEAGGKIFLTLPMKRSRPMYQSYSSSSAPAPAPAPAPSSSSSYTPAPAPAPVYTPPDDNSTYYGGGGGGCFGADCVVYVLADGEFVAVKVSQVSARSSVLSIDRDGNLTVSKVVCAVKIHRRHGSPMIRLTDSGLHITPSHPINWNGMWKKPMDLMGEGAASMDHFDGDFVYNFVLDSHHVVLVNGVPCVTFGHNLVEDSVRHVFYGSHLVVEHLSSLPGWMDGCVTVDFSCVPRVIHSHHSSSHREGCVEMAVFV
jgi:hypothetical protein